MKFSTLILSILLLAAPVSAEVDFGALSEACGVSFEGRTQMGRMKMRLSVCELTSDRGQDSSLLVISTYEKEFPPRLEKLLEQAHAPIIEKKEGEVVMLYTAGANTTCVAKFTIQNGFAEYLETETISWNDRGVFKVSDSFEDYSHLLEKRDSHIKAVDTTATSRRVSP